MIWHIIKYWWRTVAVTYELFGFGRRLLWWLFVVPHLHLFTFITLKLDYLLFPGFVKQKIENPVFIISSGRGGTTFLHRLLTSGDDFVCFKGWEMLVPSLTGRKLLRRFFKRVARRRADAQFLPKETGHEAGSMLVDEEQFLLIHVYMGHSTWRLTPLSLDRKEPLELIHGDNLPRKKEAWIMRYLSRMFQRQMYYLGRKQILAKSPAFGMYGRGLLHAFPDAKFIYLARSPYMVVASIMSFTEKKFHGRFEADTVPEDLVLLQHRRDYDFHKRLYERIYWIRDNVPADRFLTVLYDDLLTDFEPTMGKIEQFMGVKFGEKLRTGIQEQAEKQKTFRRDHEVKDAAEFGFTREQIAKDFDFVFNEHRFPV